MPQCVHVFQPLLYAERYRPACVGIKGQRWLNSQVTSVKSLRASLLFSNTASGS